MPGVIVPGGAGAAVLKFDPKSSLKNIIERKVLFYEFRSAIRLTR